jgi:hypothetical protein
MKIGLEGFEVVSVPDGILKRQQNQLQRCRYLMNLLEKEITNTKALLDFDNGKKKDQSYFQDFLFQKGLHELYRSALLAAESQIQPLDYIYQAELKEKEVEKQHQAIAAQTANTTDKADKEKSQAREISERTALNSEQEVESERIDQASANLKELHQLMDEIESSPLLDSFVDSQAINKGDDKGQEDKAEEMDQEQFISEADAMLQELLQQTERDSQAAEANEQETQATMEQTSSENYSEKIHSMSASLSELTLTNPLSSEALAKEWLTGIQSLVVGTPFENSLHDLEQIDVLLENIGGGQTSFAQSSAHSLYKEVEKPIMSDSLSLSDSSHTLQTLQEEEASLSLSELSEFNEEMDRKISVERPDLADLGEDGGTDETSGETKKDDSLEPSQTAEELTSQFLASVQSMAENEELKSQLASLSSSQSEIMQQQSDYADFMMNLGQDMATVNIGDFLDFDSSANKQADPLFTERERLNDLQKYFEELDHERTLKQANQKNKKRRWAK